ncbi:MAG: hypothetical protein Q7U84_03840 [Polynucleobacter sp.]|nr:hypothetical protein [Polynucleobacter sp.]
MTPAHLNFFSIEECGLYKHNVKKPEALDPAETFDLIYQWVQGKPIEDTLPWNPVNKNGLAKCYCHDFYKDEDTGEFLFVLWKSDTSSTGAIWGAQASAATGSSKPVEYTNKYKGNKVIWGRPAYYWIIPDLNTVVSIKVDHSVCDSTLFQEWVLRCIENRVTHPNKKRMETESGKVRFEFKDKTDTVRCAFRFDVHLRSRNTGNAQLQDLASKVTHIVRRDTIQLNSGVDERPAWVQFFDKIPLIPAKPKAKTRQIEVRAEATPTAADIKKIIETFAKAERKRSDWNNVGFGIGTNTVVWVDRYRLHENINLSNEGSTVFPASDLYSRLSAVRERILREVIADEATKKKGKTRASKGSA